MKASVMIVDDEQNFRESLVLAIEDSFAVTAVDSLDAARQALKGGLPDAILLDLRLPDGEGTELLQDLQAYGHLPVVIVMTAYATLENAIGALKHGAVDYVTKPLDIEKLRRELIVYLENRMLQKKVTSLDRQIKQIVPSFVTTGTGAMAAIVERAPAIASLPIPVLIQGETGTGKEKLAQWIHQLSGLEGELVSVSCAAVPREIFESELFGYAKGAFSGAVGMKEGLIDRADGGTLFLDEIGELTDETQAKLLRVLECGCYFRLGDSRERKARFRLITATHKDLQDPANRFRQDLYYRINGMTLELPPLRQRSQDIPLLVKAFITEANYAYNRSVAGMTGQALALLSGHQWPGNIRELKWCIHRAVATAQQQLIDSADLTLGTPGLKKEGAQHAEQDMHGSLESAVSELEKRYIMRALSASGRNKTDAARLLGISVRQLHYKIKQYGL